MLASEILGTDAFQHSPAESCISDPNLFDWFDCGLWLFFTVTPKILTMETVESPGQKTLTNELV
jgi:hypothetical protein